MNTRLVPFITVAISGLSLALTGELGGAKAASAQVVSAVTIPLTVETAPGGAQVVVSNGTGCDATPCKIAGIREYFVTVTIEKEGYETIEVAIGPGVTGLRAELRAAGGEETQDGQEKPGARVTFRSGHE